MKPSTADLQAAVARLSILRFFPGEPIAHVAIMELLDSMVSTTEQLSWLVRTMVNQVGTWEGPQELRGIFLQSVQAGGRNRSMVDHARLSRSGQRERGSRTRGWARTASDCRAGGRDFG